MAKAQLTKLQTNKSPLFLSRQEQAIRWTREHQRQLQIGLGGVGVLVLCLTILFFYRMQQRRYGLAEFSSGLSAFSKKDFPEATTHLEHAAGASSGGENVRQLALFYLGAIYRTQQPEKAQMIYNEIAAEAEKSEQSYLPQLALLQLGRIAEQRGQFSEAAQWYEKAKTLNGPFKSEAIFAHAIAMEKSGNHRAAQSSYKDFNESYPDSPISELARERGE